MNIKKLLFQEEISLRDIFGEPEGYVLEYAVLTTYSLDRKALISAICAIGGCGENPYITPQMALMNMYEKKNMTVFYQWNKMLGSNAFEDRAQFLLDEILQSCCEPVNVPDHKSFHPKVSFVCFRPEDGGAYRYRVFVSSRNLTFGAMEEMGVMAEALSADFVRKPGNLTELKEALRKFDWRLPEGGNVTVFWQEAGVSGSSFIGAMNLPSIRRAICVSPGFETNELLDLKNIERKCFHKDNSHVKLYCFEKDSGKELWIGSGNCTNSGLGNQSGIQNTECMMKIAAEPDAFCFEDMEQLLGENGYRLLENVDKPYESDEDVSGTEKCLNGIRTLELEVTQRDGEHIDAKLTIDMEEDAELPELMRVKGLGQELPLTKEGLTISYSGGVKGVSRLVTFKAIINGRLIARELLADAGLQTQLILQELGQDIADHYIEKDRIFADPGFSSGGDRETGEKASANPGAGATGKSIPKNDFEIVVMAARDVPRLKKMKKAIGRNKKRLNPDRAEFMEGLIDVILKEQEKQSE